MKIAIPCRHNLVSPVLEEATEFIIVEMENSNYVNNARIDLNGKSPVQKLQYLVDTGVDMILCGAVSNSYINSITAKGLEVVAWLKGDVDEILQAYISGKLNGERFRMPGRKRCRCRHRRANY
ncbi:MAG: hypothetical protein GF307_12220 [candidate division Zixibacteria bacterium]|nr:hypothetical protein [candidate division Zixibacteria bacterium]